MIETHCHLLTEAFDADREAVISRAIAGGVTKFIEVGYDEKYSARILDFVKARNNFFCAIGVHPHDAQKFSNSTIKTFFELAKDEKVIAIGEIGLDYYRDLSPREIQKEVFEKQIKLALDLHKPVIIHSREATTGLQKILQKYQNLRGIVHSFSGNLDDAKFYIDRGFLLGISGPITYKNSFALKEVVREIDLENFVLETDCPYLPPVPFRGQRNEPAYLNLIANEIAKIKNTETKIVEDATTKNIEKLFWNKK